ncbi:MAG: 6,7-dimethyl-8-ribityllumazine synthase [Alphaproteobacteria bacterium]|nr:6,7-dimethyl-8-ribityllumazine synthase [Alphaproteobacteria bacterium]
MSNALDPVSTERNRIAFIQADWHADIVAEGRKSFLASIKTMSSRPWPVDVHDAPGSFEIPLQAQLLAETGRYAAIVAAGFIVDGGIYRHDFVARTVLDGLMRVQLDMKVPVISMVLTPHQFHEHSDHRRFFLDHFKMKGAEAAAACLRTIQAVEKIRTEVAIEAAA